jgi:hypothetical protein
MLPASSTWQMENVDFDQENTCAIQRRNCDSTSNNCDVKLQLFLTKLGGYDMGQDQGTSSQSMAAGSANISHLTIVF